jgi:hypothetical protein
MIKDVLPKVLFIVAIVGIIAAGNYFFKEEPSTASVATSAPAEENNE